MPSISFAAEITVFAEAKTFKEKQIIRFVQNLNENDRTLYVISNNDLNNDLIDEYIVKPLKCLKSSFCNLYVVAYKNREPILLLEEKAYKINILDQTSFGVRDLRLHNDQNNEFRASTFKWSPYSYLYEQKEY